MPIKILIIDQLEVARAGLRAAISQTDDLLIVGEFSDLESSRDAIDSVRPDVVLVDFGGDIASALQEISNLSDKHPGCRVLVCSTQDTADTARAVMRSGASGFISKAARLEELLVAVRGVHDGRIFISHAPSQVGHSLSAPHLAPPSLAGGSQGEGLSHRERQVLSLVAEGFTNKQIAQRLFLSVKTVETYRSRVMRKAGLPDRAAAIRYARQVGLCETAT